MNDLEYIDHGMFTSFIPVSKDGEVAFNQMAEYTDGTGKVLSIHKQGTIQQLRQAGYKVGKAKKQGKVTAEQADEMLRELGIE
jgi:hypothetical protein